MEGRSLLLLLLALALSGCAASPEDDGPRVRRVRVGEGWARNSVNAVIFRQHALTSSGDLQYTAFYDGEARMVLARRELGSDRWELHPTRFTGDVRDAHNCISLAVDGEGRLHVAWDHHGGALKYARGIEPGGLELGEPEPMTGRHEDRVTYPEFYDLPGGDLLFLYRSGGSGRGDTLLSRYELESRRWTPVAHPLISGEGQRNAYTNQIAIDHLGRWHLSWNWRETGGVQTNHDLCYAVTDDEGRTWRRSDGSIYELPITAATAEVACPVPQGHELINQVSSAVDSAGRPMLATYWRPPGTEVPQYQLVWFDGQIWRVSQVGERSLPFSLSGGGTRRIPVSRPALAVDRRDRIYLLFRDEERGSRASVAVCEDPERRRWEVRDLTLDSVGHWEPSYDAELWRRTGEMHVFLLRVGQGQGESLEELAPQPVEVLEWRPPGGGAG